MGAISVENEYDKKMFFKTIALDGVVTFTCESWVQSKSDVTEKRIFFTDKSYLPSETPEALKSLRTADLESLRGNHEGERQPDDRIYDYDVYDDLGDPDSDIGLAWPVLGGEKHSPYVYYRYSKQTVSVIKIEPLTKTEQKTNKTEPKLTEKSVNGYFFYYRLTEINRTEPNHLNLRIFLAFIHQCHLLYFHSCAYTSILFIYTAPHLRCAHIMYICVGLGGVK
ncbi:putative linoleate 13S-lipoxygenase [Helianthus debilis subsp. tardiflorus]